MSKITAMYIRLSMEDEDASLNRKEESNSISCLLYTSCIGVIAYGSDEPAAPRKTH